MKVPNALSLGLENRKRKRGREEERDRGGGSLWPDLDAVKRAHAGNLMSNGCECKDSAIEFNLRKIQLIGKH